MLSNHTAMFGRIKLTEEQQEAIKDGKDAKVIHANAPNELGLAQMGLEMQ